MKCKQSILEENTHFQPAGLQFHSSQWPDLCEEEIETFLLAMQGKKYNLILKGYCKFVRTESQQKSVIKQIKLHYLRIMEKSQHFLLGAQGLGPVGHFNL